VIAKDFPVVVDSILLSFSFYRHHKFNNVSIVYNLYTITY